MDGALSRALASEIAACGIGIFMQRYCNFMQNHVFHSPGLHRAHEERRDALLRILREGVVGRQAELVQRLKQAGYDVTQSSVSRDLRDLGVAKVGDRYMLPGDAPAPRATFSAVAAFVVATLPAGPNLTVVRTTVGSAQSVAFAIDQARWPEVVGTISGDDTVFVATPDESAQRAFIDRLQSLASR
jgi:transcriptional regulator of arginine metabolism